MPAQEPNQLWCRQQSSQHGVIVALYVAACRYGSGMTAREASSGSLQATPLQILRSQQQSPWGHLNSQDLIDLNTAQRELMDGDDAEGEVELLERRANSLPSLQVRKEDKSSQSHGVWGLQDVVRGHGHAKAGSQRSSELRPGSPSAAQEVTSL